MDNIFIRTDPAGNIKPDKEKSTEKIDGAVATIMALDRAIRCGNDTSESVYDSRGLIFIWHCKICKKQKVFALWCINLIIFLICAILTVQEVRGYDRIP